MTEAKKIAIETSKRVSQIAIKELSISSQDIQDTLISKAQEESLKKCLEIANSPPADMTEEQILDMVSKESERVSQVTIKEYFENMNKTNAKLTKINAVKLLASLIK